MTILGQTVTHGSGSFYWLLSGEGTDSEKGHEKMEDIKKKHCLFSKMLCQLGLDYKI